MRESIGCLDRSIDILTFIEELQDVEARLKAHDKIQAVEKKAMHEMLPQPGMIELFQFLQNNQVTKNICTRNLINPVNYLIDHFIPAPLNEFEQIVTRDFSPPKPRPEPLLYIAKQLNISPEEMIMVGDSIDDMKSGTAAGCTTILLVNTVNRELVSKRSLVHFSVESLSDIIDLLEAC